MKYRPHRRFLDESMKEVTEVADFADLVHHIQAECPDWYPMEKRPTSENTKIKPYGIDDRIGWNSHLVVVADEVWGWTDGPCEI